jgi:hypothetical protein
MQKVGLFLLILGLVGIVVIVLHLFTVTTRGSDYEGIRVAIAFVVGSFLFILSISGLVLWVVGRKREKRGITQPPDEPAEEL